MFTELSRVIEQVVKDKGIDREIIIDALKAAMVSAAKKKYGHLGEFEAQFNEERGEMELYQFKTVVEKVKNRLNEISQEDAFKLYKDSGIEIGDDIGIKIETEEFGRIAAQSAKQVILQKVRDAERDVIYKEFKQRKGEIANGIVTRVEKNRRVIVDLGRGIEAVLPAKEQLPNEFYKRGDRVKGYINEVNQSLKGPEIVLSRSCNGFLKKLFEHQVPEVEESLVEIKGIVREAGSRAKIAVYSKDSDIDPVGACVGMRGSRVQGVLSELKGEKIDIIMWSPDPAKFVANSISPAKPLKVVASKENRSVKVVVPDDQLSLAIGKNGQNVRLAARLCDFRIDILTISEFEGVAKPSVSVEKEEEIPFEVRSYDPSMAAEEEEIIKEVRTSEGTMIIKKKPSKSSLNINDAVSTLEWVTPEIQEILNNAGIFTLNDMMNIDVYEFSATLNIGVEELSGYIEGIREAVGKQKSN